jgi:multidrug efflux pump subunit AcrB
MSEPDKTPRYRGPIAWMAQNSVTANLLMLVLVFGGLVGSLRVKQEVFPEFDLDSVVVMVPYPGASPRETEQGITLAIEEAVRGVEGVKRVTSTSQEGVSTSTVSLLLDGDRDKALSEIKSAIDRIQSFPEDAEKPSVGLAFNRREVISLIISGDQPLRTLHDIAENARSELLGKPNITQVDIRGVPNLEISVEVRRDRLEAFGLTLDDIANAIRFSSLELPGGGIETSSGEVLVRLADRKVTDDEFADVLVRSTLSGAQLRLGDIATIRDGYADVDLESYFNGKRAVRVVAYRVGSETPTEVATAVKEYAQVLQAELPEEIEVATWNDDSKLLAGRIHLLVRNAIQGLALVLIVLAAFLNIRLAFWVALGIPISFLGAFLLMPGLDLTVNMISLFGFIVTLGMVVDDAIVVGENAFDKMRQGIPNRQAAIEGAREMAVPVTFAILTTIVAFSPMFFVPGVSGKLFRILPLVVISVLIFSLVESFFILPAHLAHLGKATQSRGILGRLERFQEGISEGLSRFIEQRFRPALHVVLHWRYVAFSVAIALFALALGVVVSGALPFSFMPKMDSDTVIVSARLPYGARVERTQEVADILERSAFSTIEDMGGAAIYEGMLTSIGEGPAARGPVNRNGESGSHVLTLTVQLVSGSDRDFSSQEFASNWSLNTPDLAGVEALSFSSSSGPSGGAAVDIQLMHRDTSVLALASAELTTALRSYSALTDIENGYAAGKPQIDLKLRPMGRTLGLSSHDVARQVRASFYGTEALREQRGRNEFKVMVRLQQQQRQSEHDIEQLQIRTPTGGWVPLAAVAKVNRSQAPTAIKREGGRRIVNVQGELAPGAKSSREVLDSVQSDILPDLMSRHPGLEARLAGQQREQNETFASLGQNYLFALFVIFGLLAVPFKSYTQPFIVMAAIPFGFIGAVAGHLIMGYELSLISMFGIIALSGVVVNDSLVLMDSTNRFRRSGMDAREAVVAGACRRFRPILLTSLTTFFGLAPMILETEMQARFLIPMAVSLGFGVLFATVLILLLVPVLYLLREDVAGFLRWARDATARLAA